VPQSEVSMKKIAGIDVHKQVLMVVIADAANPELVLQKGKFRMLSGW